MTLVVTSNKQACHSLFGGGMTTLVVIGVTPLGVTRGGNK